MLPSKKVQAFAIDPKEALYATEIGSDGLPVGPPPRKRANTTNTIYVGATIAQPDKEALMRSMAVWLHGKYRYKQLNSSIYIYIYIYI